MMTAINDMLDDAVATTAKLAHAVWNFKTESVHTAAAIVGVTSAITFYGCYALTRALGWQMTTEEVVAKFTREAMSKQ